MMLIGLVLRLKHDLRTFRRMPCPWAVLECAVPVPLLILLYLFKVILMLLRRKEGLLMILCFFLLYAVVAQMPDGIVKLVDVES